MVSSWLRAAYFARPPSIARAFDRGHPRPRRNPEHPVGERGRKRRPTWHRRRPRLPDPDSRAARSHPRAPPDECSCCSASCWRRCGSGRGAPRARRIRPSLTRSFRLAPAREGRVGRFSRGTPSTPPSSSPSPLEGRTVKTFHANLPAERLPRCCPCCAKRACRSWCKSQQQPFAVQVVMTLLPWALIIGVWVWMSRRAQGMLGTGGPLAGFMKNQSRKFDKATSVNVTFEDIAGLKSAKRRPAGDRAVPQGARAVPAPRRARSRGACC